MADSGPALAATVPLTSPVQTFADRFEAWKAVIHELARHFRSISDAEVTHNDHLRKIKDTLADPLTTHEGFEKGGSVHDIGQLLFEQQTGRVTHSDHIVLAIDREIVPELEHARDFLTEKIQEIKGFEQEFKTTLPADLETSRRAVLDLQDAITSWEAAGGGVDHKRDPFVVDLATRKTLRHSLGEETYLRESTLNLEQSAKELEQQVVAAIQRTLGKYNALVSREAAELAVMSQKMEDSLLAGHLSSEWELFRKRQLQAGVLIDAKSSQRSLENVSYQGKDHVSTMPICDGWLEKKSNVLGKYTTSFYIVSPSRFLHEFKSNDLRVDMEPTFSLYLPDCELGSTSADGDKVFKFILRGKQLGGLHTEHNWVFRAKSREDMLTWYTNIGRAADKSFQFTGKPLQTSDGSLAGATGVSRANTISARAVQPQPRIPLEEDAADAEPYRGPESLTTATVLPTPRPAAGRFNSAAAFKTPLAAVTAGLHAPPATAKDLQPLATTELTRTATSSYGVQETPVSATPMNGPDHAHFVHQASIHSATAGFLKKEILDDNAHLPYDAEHTTHSTLPGDEDFKPADADVKAPRTLSTGAEPAKPRRQASLAFREVAGSPASAVAVTSPARQQQRPRPGVKTPSRQATASYGDPSAVPPMQPLTTDHHVDPAAPTGAAAAAAAAYVSPYFPAPGAGTTGKLPAEQFERALASANAPTTTSQDVTVHQPTRAGSMSGVSAGAGQTPSRRMSLSDQILGTAPSNNSLADLESAALIAKGTHSDAVSPYPHAQRFKVTSRQASVDHLASPAVSTMADYDVAPHLRVGTQSNEARYKVPSRKNSRSASGVATPQGQQSEQPSEVAFDHSALDDLSAAQVAQKLSQVSVGERARGTPSRGTSIDLQDGATASGTRSPAFKINQRQTFRGPPSRGSSLSLGAGGGAGDEKGLLGTIAETFEKDLAAAKGNSPGDTHVPGEYPATPSEEKRAL
ncbi:hypothetical protein BCR37DRAFT_378497 [Protomyces lactucae-debilis]|uniref:PH domain-containing protein n=1 Tax=Protomyces lactucae-debilis TaxID=2754530 RepID=A0A1Y2FKG3_PROLT|nr:uncharacterized protein BCR37DRAFT_378497 [Protomyces lactucae-debilis]ORY84463.1 hypothetical protein BCR37DRAFT_378497 [Protomyces lactucae-debilis]